MKVFAHYFYDNNNDVEYRWRTIIQVGDSWDIRGEYKGDENTVINWFVNTTQAMFDAFEPSVQ